MRDVGGTGFVSLNDFLGANQGVLDAGYAQDQAAGHQVGDTLQGYLDQIGPEARGYAAKYGRAPGGVQSYDAALPYADQAREAGRKYGSEFGMAGSGSNPVSGEQAFNSALAYGAHGGDYKTLGEWLTGLSTQPQTQLAGGIQQGLADYAAAHQPVEAPEKDPEQPVVDPRVGHPVPHGRPDPNPYAPTNPRRQPGDYL